MNIQKNRNETKQLEKAEIEKVFPRHCGHHFSGQRQAREASAERRKKLNNGMSTNAPLTTTASNPRMSAKAVQRWLYVMGYYSL